MTKLNKQQTMVANELTNQVLNKFLKIEEITQEFVQENFKEIITEVSNAEEFYGISEKVSFNSEGFNELIKQVESNIEEYYAQKERTRIANEAFFG